MPKILAIDDKKDNLETIRALLQHLMPECEVLTALSGEEGLQIARDELPDTIVLDIIMPGMDGYGVCRILKTDPVLKKIPVLMLTAIKTDTQSRIKGLQHGADAFFTKPIDPYELSAQLEVLLRIKRTEDQLRREKENLAKDVDEKTRLILENEIKLNQIVEGFSIPAFVIDTEHKITHWNRALELLTGMKADNLLGSKEQWKAAYNHKKPMLVDLLMDEAEDTKISEYYEGKWKKSQLLPDALETEINFLDHYDREKWYYFTAVLIKNDKGEKIAGLQTIQNITERKKNEIQLDKYRQNLEKLVEERTKELEKNNEELKQLNKLFNGREFRIKELRDKVKSLEKKIRELESI